MSSPPQSPGRPQHRRRRESGAFDPPNPRRELSPEDVAAADSPEAFARVVPEHAEAPASSLEREGEEPGVPPNPFEPPNVPEQPVYPEPAPQGTPLEDESDTDQSTIDSIDDEFANMKPLVKIIAAAMKQLAPANSNETSNSVVTQHRISTDLNKELAASSYGKNKYEGHNNIVKFSNFYDFVSRKYVKYTPLINSKKFTSLDFFNEVVAETMIGRVPDTLQAAAVSQPAKYETIVTSPQTFLTQVAKLAILPNEANSVFDKASELPSRTGTLKLFNQLKKLQTVSKVMLQVHGSPILEDNILLFLLRQKMHPEIKAKVEADMAEKNYSLSTEGIETFYVHKATQYETAKGGNKKDHQVNFMDTEELPLEPSAQDTDTNNHQVNLEDNESSELENSLFHLQEQLVDSEYYDELAEPLEQALNAIANNRKGKKPQRRRQAPQKLQAMQGTAPGPARLQPNQGPQPNYGKRPQQSCPFNWKPPSMTERRERYANGQCTTCGSKDHFRANCPCAAKMQNYIAQQPPIQQRLHNMLDALAPNVTEMDEKEQDFHVETLDFLEKAEQSFQ